VKPENTPEARLANLQKKAKDAGGSLLSTEYLGSTAYYVWKCAEGHIWEATPIGQGKTRWCPKCGFATRARKKTQTTEQVNLRLSVRGVKLAGEYDPKVKIQKCICLVCDKPTTASFTKIPKGYGCKACLRKIQPTYRRKKIDDILSELRKYQVTLLDAYIGVSKPMLFRCDVCKIEFTTKIDSLRRSKKHGCKESNEVVTLRLEKYFSDLGFTLNAHPVSLEKPCSITCNQCGIKTKLVLAAFRKMKVKCRNCSDLSKLENIRLMAESKGGELQIGRAHV